MFPVARLSLSLVAGPLRGRKFTFDGGPFVIGRAAGCTISIPSEGVSRAHARLEYGNGGYWLIPEKTVNGTRVNDVLVLNPTQLSENDRITIHDSTFLVVYGEPDPVAELAAIMPPPLQRPTPVASARTSIAGPNVPNGPFPDPDLQRMQRLDTKPIRHVTPAPVPALPMGGPTPLASRIRWPLWIAAGVVFVGIVVAGVVI